VVWVSPRLPPMPPLSSVPDEPRRFGFTFRELHRGRSNQSLNRQRITHGLSDRPTPSGEAPVHIQVRLGRQSIDDFNVGKSLAFTHFPPFMTG
jgi:hypothetical protein